MPNISTESRVNTFISQSDSYLNNSDYKLALEEINKAYQLNPNNKAVLLHLSTILVKQERYHEALSYLEQLDKIDLDNFHKDYLLGRVYYETSDDENSLTKSNRYLNKAATHFMDDETDSNCLYFAGITNAILAQMDDDKNSALKYYGAAIRLLQPALKYNKFEKFRYSIISDLYCAEGYYVQKNYLQALESMFSARKKLDKEFCPNLEEEWNRISDLLVKTGFSEKIRLINEKAAEIKRARQDLRQKEQEYDKALAEKQSLVKQKDEVASELKVVKEKIKKNNTLIENKHDANRRGLNELQDSLNQFLDSTPSVNKPQPSNAHRISNNPNGLYNNKPTTQEAVPVHRESTKKECSIM